MLRLRQLQRPRGLLALSLPLPLFASTDVNESLDTAAGGLGEEAVTRRLRNGARGRAAWRRRTGGPLRASRSPSDRPSARVSAPLRGGPCPPRRRAAAGAPARPVAVPRSARGSASAARRPT